MFRYFYAFCSNIQVSFLPLLICIFSLKIYPEKNSCFILLLLPKFPYYFFPIPKERFFLYKKNDFLCNIGLNLGLRLPRIQTYIVKNPFIYLIFYKKCRMLCMRHFYTASILFYIPLQRFHSGLHIVNFTKLHSFFHCFNRKNLQLFLDLIRDVPKIVFVCLRNQNSLYPGAFRRH